MSHRYSHKVKLHQLGLFAILSLFLFSCERVVEIENPYPVKARYCQVNDSLIGRWQSDSVWVLTSVDSLDTVYVNKRPTYFYDLRVICDEDTTFDLTYVNFSGVETREAYSNNFESYDSVIFLFNELDFDRSDLESTFKLHYRFSSDSTFDGHYLQRLNADQTTKTQIWMRRVN